jgi:L-cysteine desulfidase
MIESREILIEILRKEITPAIGCTEPAAIGIAVAYAFNAAIGNLNRNLTLIARLDPEEVISRFKEAIVKTSLGVFKNAQDVGIPNTNGGRGKSIAAALALFGNPSLELEIFGERSVPANALPLASNLVDKINFSIDRDQHELFIDALVRTSSGSGRAVIKQTHTNVVLVETQDRVLYELADRPAEKAVSDQLKECYKNLDLRDLVGLVRDMPEQAEEITRKCIKMNSELSDIGMSKPTGMGVGHALYEYSETTNEIATYMAARTAAATDARMFGILKPAMSIAGSGNQGIAATMPIIAYAEKKDVDERLLVQSVLLSCLLTIWVAYHSKRLSATCGCAGKSGVGASGGLAYLMSNGDIECCERSIQNFIATMTGVICGGANYGCALCAAEITHCAFQGSLLAIEGVEPPQTSGILGRTVKESVENVSKVVDGMMIMNERILDILRSKSS